MGRAAVFVDGAYLDYVLKDEFERSSIDYARLSSELTTGMDLLRTYYYHCLPYQSPETTADEASRFARAQKFYDALSRHPRFQVRLGKLELRGKGEDGKPIFQQKRVDILLGVDLVLLSAKRMITDAVLIAGDSDFLPAVSCAKEEGVLVHLVHGTTHQPHRELWDAADERIALTQELVNRILRERTLF